MKLVDFKHNEDYVRFSKDLTIKVNDLITVEANICGGVVRIDSELFGKVVILEDPDTSPTYYIGGKKTKYLGFKELYNQLFQDNYSDFIRNIEQFAEKEVLNTFENNINELTKKQKVKLLREQIDCLPRFQSECGKIIVYHCWAVNEVLYSLNIPRPSTKKYNRIHEDGSGYGVEMSVYQHILNELPNK